MAVLGAGIMGCCTAIVLARRGVHVTLVDEADRPMTGASRWNEGKIHLGYLYAGDGTLATVRRLLPGGLAFRPAIEAVLDQSIAPAIADHDETYLVHRASVVDAEATAAHVARVATLVAAHPARRSYLCGDAGRPPRRLSLRELREIADHGDVVAGFRVAERSVATRWVADRLSAAVVAEPRIELRLGTHVDGGTVLPDGRYRVLSVQGADGPYDAVVNALWQGRLAVDRSMGLVPPTEVSHRYRVAAFVRTPQPVDVPSVVIGTGPFGDAKRYTEHDLYLSWYPAGLLLESADLAPPPAPRQTREGDAIIAKAIIEALGQYLPAVRSRAFGAAEVQVRGGWVYASGQGRLSDPSSTLHRRDRVGITATGRYISVDTGKYSIAPWLAAQVVDRLKCGRS